MKRLSIGFVLAAMSGCQLWLEVDPPQCQSDRACEQLLGNGYTCSNAGVCIAPRSDVEDSGMMDADTRPPLDPRWACVREETKDFNPDPDRMLKMRMDVVDLTTLKPPMGLVAAACDPGDIQCQTPRMANVTPGEDGFMEFDIPHGWEGFLQMSAPGFVPGLSYDSKPYLANVTVSGPALISPGVLSVFYTNSGNEFRPDAGLVVLEVRDCNGGAGDGVSFDPVDEQTPFYFEGLLPSRTLTQTTISNQLGANREDRAVGGFSNLDAGYKSFVARLPETGDQVSRITVQVRYGHITYVRMRAGY